MDSNFETGDEVWKPIPDTKGRYEASSMGRVRATFRPFFGRPRCGMGEQEGDVLKSYLNERGYWVVSMDLGDSRTARTVASCLLLAFCGPRPSPVHRATFLDGDRENLAPHNLAWMSPKENKDNANSLGHTRRRPAERVDDSIQSSICSV
jgi:hypothetical protein